MSFSSPIRKASLPPLRMNNDTRYARTSHSARELDIGSVNPLESNVCTRRCRRMGWSRSAPCCAACHRLLTIPPSLRPRAKSGSSARPDIATNTHHPTRRARSHDQTLDHPSKHASWSCCAPPDCSPRSGMRVITGPGQFSPLRARRPRASIDTCRGGLPGPLARTLTECRAELLLEAVGGRAGGSDR